MRRECGFYDQRKCLVRVYVSRPYIRSSKAGRLPRTTRDLLGPTVAHATLHITFGEVHAAQLCRIPVFTFRLVLVCADSDYLCETVAVGGLIYKPNHSNTAMRRASSLSTLVTRKTPQRMIGSRTITTASSSCRSFVTRVFASFSLSHGFRG